MKGFARPGPPTLKVGPKSVIGIGAKSLNRRKKGWWKMAVQTEGQKTRKRDAKGKWVKGCGPGPGKPKGMVNNVARLLRGKWVDDAEKIADMIKAQALEGDLEAARIILDRLYPRPKDAPVFLDMPKAEGLADMTRRIIWGVSDGSLTPSEGQALAGIVAQHCKVVETDELTRRIDEISKKLNQQEGNR
jgi:hypothetical protein